MRELIDSDANNMYTQETQSPPVWEVSHDHDKDGLTSEVTYEGTWLRELLHSVQGYIEWIATPVA